MDMSKYREMFLSEAKEHLRDMSRQLVLIEKDPSDREGIDALFREAHSIKEWPPPWATRERRNWPTTSKT